MKTSQKQALAVNDGMEIIEDTLLHNILGRGMAETQDTGNQLSAGDFMPRGCSAGNGWENICGG